jgi:hypothetical protein
MQAKNWAFKGGIAALLALGLTYFILEPAPTASSYGSLLGWSGMIGVVAVIVQGFRKTKKQSNPPQEDEKIARYDLGLDRWDGIHTALSISVTAILAVHAAFFFSSLWELTLAIWLGATGFILLLVLNLSGLITESKRKSRTFGSLKRLHVILMLFVLALSMLHVELVVGMMIPRSIVGGVIIALAVVFVVFVSVPITQLRAGEEK